MEDLPIGSEIVLKVVESETEECNGCGWNQCIPYNEKTAHLLGTTGEWKGGEG